MFNAGRHWCMTCDTGAYLEKGKSRDPIPSRPPIHIYGYAPVILLSTIKGLTMIILTMFSYNRDETSCCKRIMRLEMKDLFSERVVFHLDRQKIFGIRQRSLHGLGMDAQLCSNITWSVVSGQWSLHDLSERANRYLVDSRRSTNSNRRATGARPPEKQREVQRQVLVRYGDFTSFIEHTFNTNISCKLLHL